MDQSSCKMSLLNGKQKDGRQRVREIVFFFFAFACASLALSDRGKKPHPYPDLAVFSMLYCVYCDSEGMYVAFRVVQMLCFSSTSPYGVQVFKQLSAHHTYNFSWSVSPVLPKLLEIQGLCPDTCAQCQNLNLNHFPNFS